MDAGSSPSQSCGCGRFFGCCQHPQLEPAGRVGGKGCNLQEQNAQPVREHGSHGKHDGASRVTNHGRHVAAQTPPPPLPPSPPGHLARAPASPPPRVVCSKLRWFFSRQQVLSGLPFAMAARHHHGHSPIPFERCGAWWPPSPPRQGQCHPGSLPAHIRRRRPPLVPLPLAAVLRTTALR